MSTFPRDQRFIVDAVRRYGQPSAIAAFQVWLEENPNVIEVPTESTLPAELASYAVASLTAAADEMEKIFQLDEDRASEQENDRLVIRSIADRLTRDMSHDLGMGSSG